MSNKGQPPESGRHRSLLSIGKPSERPKTKKARGNSLLAGAKSKSETSKTELMAKHRLSRSRRETVENHMLSELGKRKELERPEHEPKKRIFPSSRNTSDANFRSTASSQQSWETPSSRYDDGYRNSTNVNGEWQPLINPADVIGGILSSKSIIVLFTVIGLIVGALMAISTPKLYYSTAEVLIDPRELKLSNTELRQTELPYSATLALIENQVRIITSDTVVRRVVERLNLQRDPEFNGSLVSGIGEVFSIARMLLGGSPVGKGDDLTSEAIDTLYERMFVERSGKTFVVTITVASEEADKAALIANTFTKVYLETNTDFQASTVNRASNEVTARLDELRESVEQAERAVERYKADNGIVDARGRLITDDELLRANDTLSAARNRTVELNAKASSLRDLDISAVTEGGLPEQVSSPALVTLRGQYATARQTVDQLAVNLGSRHPRLKEAQARLESSRRAIQAELGRIVDAAQVELRRAVKQEQELAAKLAQLKARQASMSDDLIELRELERDAASKRSIYENYLLRSREIGQQAGLNTSNINVISEAQPAKKPEGMRRAVVTLLGGIAGFLTGLLAGGLRGAWTGYRYSDRRPHTSDIRNNRDYHPAGPSNVRDLGDGNQERLKRLSERIAQKRTGRVAENLDSGDQIHGNQTTSATPAPAFQYLVAPHPYSYSAMPPMMPFVPQAYYSPYPAPLDHGNTIPNIYNQTTNQTVGPEATKSVQNNNSPAQVPEQTVDDLSEIRHRLRTFKDKVTSLSGNEIY